jgi:class 3 adenylate cyclase
MVFVDVVGSTRLSERLDPEEFLDVLRSYCSICDAQVRAFGGQIARAFGDGVLASFGVPQAHEDDPERAVHAALAIIATLKGHEFATTDSGSLHLTVRIGVNTGLVVVSGQESPDGQSEVFGNAAHVAAKLQTLAEPNGIVVARSTYELFGGAFECEYLGEKQLPGMAEPLACWNILGPRGAESRFARRRHGPLTQMVGRAAELADLSTRWREASGGKGSATLISGESGIGKSRLVHEFRHSLDVPPGAVQYYQCSPFHLNTPLYPFIEWTRRWARLHDADTPSETLRKLRAYFAPMLEDAARALPYIAALISVPAFDGFEPADLGIARERERALEIIADSTLAYSRLMPVLFVVEDAQWIDPTSVEFLRRLLPLAANEHLMIIVTHRADEPLDWLPDVPVHTMALPRLGPEDCERFVDAAAHDAPLPRAVRARIVEQTDRVPLFIEELTRNVLDSGLVVRKADHWVLSAPLPETLVPASIQDLLTERLDRVGPAKGVAQVASVFGLRFQVEGLREIAGMDETVLRSAVDQLEAAGLVRKQRDTPQEAFIFKHAMLQEAAYASLLKEERRELHGRAARWLERVSAEASAFAETPAVLAYHYARAGLDREAVNAWIHAGQSALRRSAIKEAIGHLRAGLELVSKLPASPERYQSEIQLQLQMAMAYTARGGWGQNQVALAHARVLELSQHHGTIQEKSTALWGVAIGKLVGAELPKAIHHADEFLAFAEECGDDEVVLMAHAAALLTKFYAGYFKDSLASADAILHRYDPAKHGHLAQRYQHDPRILALVYAGHIEWLRGRPGRGRACSREARRLARELGHPFMRAFALTIGAADHYYEYEFPAQLSLLQEGLEVAREHDLRLFELFGPLWAVEAVSADRPGERTLQRMLAVASDFVEHDHAIDAPFYWARIARQFGHLGVIDRARELAADAETLMRQTGTRWFEPEVLRIRGELLAQEPDPHCRAAVDLFEAAAASARDLGAPGWGLRAATSLGQLLFAHGRAADAVATLTGARAAFPIEESSADLREADALIGQWSQALSSL